MCITYFFLNEGILTSIDMKHFTLLLQGMPPNQCNALQSLPNIPYSIQFYRKKKTNLTFYTNC